ncbi:MAG TPA: response regulator transcription factor [Lacibacter sp.]|nr:response regulator transcription factor [Lacibacter sp.]HMO88566.1 response regulator transcription factor [Lacibacter sp.]HMP86322.1 response regulator transcription factor [Lacibacter sp.]
MPIKIAIVDDKPGNRNIIRSKLMHHSNFGITLTAENGKDFLDKMKSLPLEKQPDIVLMDLEMPEMDGVDAVTAGSYLYPSVRFVMLTIFDDEEKIFNAIKAGASGYLLKEESSDNIADVLNQMFETGVGPISPGIAYKILQLVQNNQVSLLQKQNTEKEKIPFNLTDREQEILKLLVQGLLYKEIGKKLDISTNTAKKHVMNIYSKLHVNSKSQALALAYEKGLI